MSKAPTKRNDAVDLLDADHIAVKKLFQQYNKLAEADAPADERKALATQICHELTVHAQIEEEIFYPAVREATGDTGMMDEATVEHASAKDLIAQIEAMQADEPMFDAKVIVLGEYIDHHVTEEREEMFEKARKTDLDLKAMRDQLMERKQALEAEMTSTAG
ncbi:hemerythrin domain-containing protein [Pseudacidovorax intermedius]|uniref:Hemerythrin n=1 Tax=Pseudacidovorax intermedius TaxID=433924 RepID=A0A147GML9_9BURK|nr:hemerythrin domain-containing protein [Pseudacidovorax intermedius]KTT14985.1 hemerythrin [Pseudacidovorax intermedius]